MRNNDQEIIDYIRNHGSSSPGRLLFFMDGYDGSSDTIKEVRVILMRLVDKKRLTTSTNGLIFRLPYGGHQADCRFTIREAKRVGGTTVWGVVWEAGGESWSWDIYGMALDHAREKMGVGVSKSLVEV